MHALNIPDQYIMKRGGWKSDKVLKKVYRGTIESEEKKFTDKINEHFTQIMQHDMQHEPKKTATFGKNLLGSIPARSTFQ